MNRNVLIWDFDGTLAEREGGWSGTILSLLREANPACAVTADEIREHIRAGFPWHSHEEAHPHLCDADAWWAELVPVFERAMRRVGADAATAARLAPRMREAYLEPTPWRVYEDVFPALETLSARGWTHVVLSNHVPELAMIVERLGLLPRMARVFNSALIGYEKPHPEAFAHVLRAIGPAERVWMIGDSMTADVGGAKAAGIPGVLVRKFDARAEMYCEGLKELPAFLDRRWQQTVPEPAPA